MAAKRPRTAVLNIRLTAAEESTLERRRNAAGGLKASVYVRSVLFSSGKQIPNLAARLHRIITRLNDVTPKLGRDRKAVEALGNELRDIYTDALGDARLAQEEPLPGIIL
jgi:hypothetical protein